MAHYKRRRRRRGGIKGHCFLCSLRTRDGRRNGRVPTIQELKAQLSYEEELKGTGVVPEKPARHGFWMPSRPQVRRGKS